MKMTGKHVLVVSPEPWVGVHISKHVLARTLKEAGNTVCFWGPPVANERGLRLVRDEGVELAYYRHWFRGVNYLPKWVGKAYYASMIRKLEQLTGKPFDAIWCFDTTRMQEFPDNKGQQHILHLVDYDTLDTGAGLIRTADVVLTVAEPISEHARRVAPNARVYCVGHALDARWLEGKEPEPTAGPPRIAAYAGHLQNNYIDWEMIAATVGRHPEIHFDLYGPYDPTFPNASFQQVLRSPNTTFHGLLPKADLIPRIRAADILFFCYRAYELKAIASNHHKVLEYLSTGRPIVGSHVSTFEGMGLFAMAGEREEFPLLFDRVCQKYAAENTPALRKARMSYARERTMARLVEHVQDLMREGA